MKLRWGIVVLVFSLVAAACGGGDREGAGGQDPTAEPEPTATAEPDPEAEVRVAAGEDTWPTEGEGAEATRWVYPLNANVFETLIVLGSDYTLQPGLAESWELVEPNTWRFHLRQGVVFHDGSEFNADDVMWTWAQRQMEGKTLSTVVNTLDENSVQKVDDYTVDITPAVPNLRLPEQILHPEGAILSEGQHFDTEGAVGTGPFRIVEYREGESATVERFEDYWGEPAQVRRMVYRFLPDPQTRIEALRAGEVDLALDVPPDAVSALESDPDFRIVRSDPGRNQLIYINTTGQEPYDLGADPAVREAVSLAVDRDAYVDVVFDGEAEPGRLMAPASVLGEHADIVDPVSYDPDQARQVLDEAGWVEGADGVRERDGRKLELALIGWAEVSPTAMQFLQAQLGEVGIDVQIKQAPDQPTYRGFYQNTEFDLDLEVPNQNDGNPAFLPVLRMYSGNEAAHRFAPGGEFDDWAEAALAAETTDEAQRASAEMMRILIHDEHIVVPVAAVYRIYGMASNVDLGDPHPSQTNQRWDSLVVRSPQ